MLRCTADDILIFREWLARIELRGWLGRVVTLEVTPTGDIHVMMLVRDRETNLPIHVAVSRALHAQMATNEAGFEHFQGIVHSTIAGSLHHELQEAWHVDGVRVNDPHRDERTP